MRHKWKKRRFRQKLYSEFDYGESARPVKVYGETKECSYCGLRKGMSRDYGFFPKLVYFDSEKILSTEKLPFTCQGEWIGGELPVNKSKVVFICEDEFKV